VAKRVPNIGVSELGFNAAASRTALGLALDLPQFRCNNNYQLQETLGMLRRAAIRGAATLRSATSV